MGGLCGRSQDAKGGFEEGGALNGSSVSSPAGAAGGTAAGGAAAVCTLPTLTIRIIPSLSPSPPPPPRRLHPPRSPKAPSRIGQMEVSFPPAGAPLLLPRACRLSLLTHAMAGPATGVTATRAERNGSTYGY